MNIRRKRLQGIDPKKKRCANCFACLKDTEYCYLNKNEVKNTVSRKEKYESQKEN